jgi:hypothetical protein
MKSTASDAVIAAVMARLAAAIAGARVEPWPDEPEKYRAQARVPILLVTVTEWRFEKPDGPASDRVIRTHHLGVLILTNSLKPGQGGPALVEAAAKALGGFRPSGSGPIRLIDAQMIDRQDGLHRYVVRGTTSHPFPVGSDEDLSNPLIRITVEGDADQVIPSAPLP